MPVSMGEASGKLTLDAKGFFESIKSAKKELSDFDKTLGNSKTKLSDTESAVKKSGDKFTEYGNKIDGAGNKINSAGTKIDGVKGKLTSFSAKLKTNSSDLKNSGTSVDEYGNKINTTGGKVESAKTKLQEFGTKVKDVATKIKDSLPSVETLGTKLESAGTKMKSTGEKLQTTGKKLTNSVTVAAGAAVGASVKTATDFESKMKKVQATSGASEKDMKKLTAAAKKMGAETKFSASEAAEALNYMAMAGWKTDQMVNGLPGIMNLAAASGEDLATTSDIVTDALTGFGMEAKDSSHFADILAKASSSANTNVSMMGETFKYVAPVAGSFGYKAEDVAVAVGLMANSGIKASQAGTTLRGAITKLAKPTDTAWTAMQQFGIVTTKTSKALNKDYVTAQKQVEKAQSKAKKAQLKYNEAVEKYGKNSTQAKEKLIDLKDAESALAVSKKNLSSIQKTSTKQEAEYNDLMFDSKGNAKSFKDVMDRLRETFKKLTPEQQAQAAATIFGQESMSGMLAIINASDKDYQKLTKSIDDSTGSAQKMSDIQMSGLSGQITALKSKIEGLAISLGEKVIPLLTPVVDFIGKIVDKFSKLNPNIQKAIVYTMTISAIAGPFISTLGKAISAIGSIVGGLGKLLKSLKGIPGALSKIKDSKAFAFLSNQFSKIPELASKAVGGIKSAFTTGITKLKSPVSASIGTLGAAVSAGIIGWQIGTWIYDHFHEQIDGVLHPIFAKIQEFVEGWMPFWEGVGSDVYDALSSGFESYKTFFEGIGENIYDWIHDKANKLSKGFKDFVTKIKKTISNKFNAYKNTFEGFGEKVYNWIHNKSNSLASGFKDFSGKVKSAISTGFTSYKDKFEGFGEKVYNWIHNKSNSKASGFKDFAGKVKSGISTGFTTYKDKLEKFGENVYDWIHDKANSKVGGFKDFVKNIVETLKKAFNEYKDTFEGFGEKAYTWIHGDDEDDDEFVKNLKSVGPSYTPGKKHAMGLDYVPYDGYNAILHKGERVLTKQENVQYTNNKYSGGDTFIFNSPKAINEFEAARQMKKIKRELAEGF